MQLEVGHGLANHFGTLHGGATSLIVDVLGTMALLTKDVSRPGAMLACRLLPLEVLFIILEPFVIRPKAILKNSPLSEI